MTFNPYAESIFAPTDPIPAGPMTVEQVQNAPVPTPGGFAPAEMMNPYNSAGINQGGGRQSASGWQNPFGAPPERRRLTDENGNMLPQYQLDMMKQREMSPWAMLQQRMAQNQYRRSMSDIGDQANRGMMSGWNEMARAGGITSGGRVALAKQANMARMKGAQGLAGGMQDTMLDITGRDIGNQLSAEKYNIGNAIDQADREYLGAKDVYGQNAEAYSNEQYARALERASNEPDTWSQMQNWTGRWLNPFHWGNT